jgi:hypothetical protein
MLSPSIFLPTISHLVGKVYTMWQENTITIQKQKKLHNRDEKAAFPAGKAAIS